MTTHKDTADHTRRQAGTLAAWVRYYPAIFGSEHPRSVVRSWGLAGHDAQAIGDWVTAIERAAVDAGVARRADVRVCHPMVVRLFSRFARDGGKR